MKLYGIFNFQNGEYKLLRYSDCAQSSRSYQKFNFPNKTYIQINEVCLPDIVYDSNNIGKTYDIQTEQFS